LVRAALAAVLLALPIASRAQVAVGVTIAPPLRYEAVPPPRAGWVWAPGLGPGSTASMSGAAAIGSPPVRAIAGWPVSGRRADGAGSGCMGIGPFIDRGRAIVGTEDDSAPASSRVHDGRVSPLRIL